MIVKSKFAKSVTFSALTPAALDTALNAYFTNADRAEESLMDWRMLFDGTHYVVTLLVTGA